MEVVQESIYVPVGRRDDRLHLRRLATAQGGPAVFLLHGAIENGRIFYSTSGKGLGPFLARAGFEVFVGDLRGRGGSTPRLSGRSAYGQTDAITADLPAMLEAIRARTGGVAPYWAAHSWGGVLMLSHLARDEAARRGVRGLVCFGTKRTIQVFNREVFWKIHFFWNRFAKLLVAANGYLPARRWGVGSDDESALSHAQSVDWIRPGPWVDTVDGFDYAAALARVELPPALFIAGASDRCLGHPDDVRRLVAELGPQRCEVRVLARANGNLHDYGHVDMLTHPDAVRDHFPAVVEWMRRQGGRGVRSPSPPRPSPVRSVVPS